MDQPLGGAPYHQRYLLANQRWLAYSRHRKLQLGVEEHRTPGLNTWLTHQRALKMQPKVNGDSESAVRASEGQHV